jgi:transposase InsO family protein
VWGLNLVGPLQKAPGGYTHLLVAIDKFSKWIEVRPLNSIRSKQAVAFFTNIIHRFGVPNSIITDNGTHFTGRKFLDFYEDHHIRVDWAAVAHPMTNGQVERANGMILQGLKHVKVKNAYAQEVEKCEKLTSELSTCHDTIFNLRRENVKLIAKVEKLDDCDD